MQPLYILERHEHGWLFCAAASRSGAPKAGIPVNAFSETAKLFHKSAVMNGKIATALNRQGHHSRAIMATGLLGALSLWEDEVNLQVANRPPEERWWCSTGTGASSSAIFRVLCEPRWKDAASDYARGPVPHDAEDFGRCLGLLKALPAWRERLPEVAAAYPDTEWAAIIERWDELTASPRDKQTEILQAI